MTITVNQVLHLPWLGVYARAALSDAFVLSDEIQFLKQDFFNRNRIKTPQGAQWLTVPVKYPFEIPQTEVLIDNTKDWGKRNWKMLLMNYSKAPYFHEHRDFFEKAYKAKWDKLIDLNLLFHEYTAEHFGTKARFYRASEMGLDDNAERSQKLLSMCKKLKADTYFSGQGGRRYLNEKLFEENNIQVTYQNFQHPVYPQLFGPFIPELSSIDLLFNCGPESLDILLGRK